MSVAGNLLADQLDGTRDWTLKLIADIAGDEWTYQPAEGVQHALWLCGHLAVAEHLLVLTRALGGSPPDAELVKCFPIGSVVVDPGEIALPSPASVRAKMDATHAEVLAGIRGMSDEQLSKPCMGAEGKPHPHYRTNLEAISHCDRHEAFHAGQIAMLRRMMGKAFLR